MRFGCCLNMIAKGPDGSGAESAPALARAGYDYLELSLSHLMRLAPAERERVLEPVRSAGLPCEACNNLFPAAIMLTGPKADHAAALAYAAEAFTLAEALGARVVGFGSGKARNAPEGFPRERAWDQLVSLARALDPLAAAQGLVIAMEHLNRGESSILTSFSETVRFVREVDRPRVRAHLARLTGRTWPRLPSPDLRSLFAALGAIGYDQRISVEAFSDDPASECGPTLALLKTLVGEGPAGKAGHR
jgi:D-psicose/D-tagatose/L-ribulose 3-epimerase